MGVFYLTNKAKADLISIAAYTQREWGRKQRLDYLKQLDDVFRLLSTTPEVGTEIDFVKLGYRKFPHASHVIFYRSLGDNKIEIVRILHKRMDVKGNLSKI